MTLCATAFCGLLKTDCLCLAKDQHYPFSTAQENSSGSGLLNLLIAHLSKTQKHEHSVLQMTSLKGAPTSESNCPTIVQRDMSYITTGRSGYVGRCHSCFAAKEAAGKNTFSTPRMHMPIGYHWLAFIFT